MYLFHRLFVGNILNPYSLWLTDSIMLVCIGRQGDNLEDSILIATDEDKSLPTTMIERYFPPCVGLKYFDTNLNVMENMSYSTLIEYSVHPFSLIFDC
jgi:hypothetical protein